MRRRAARHHEDATSSASGPASTPRSQGRRRLDEAVVIRRMTMVRICSARGWRWYLRATFSPQRRRIRMTLKLISSMATREVLNELVGRYTTEKISTEAAGGVDVAKRVQNGEAVDIVVLASNAIDKLIAEGKVLAG